jgi:signal transduction histidine kinase
MVLRAGALEINAGDAKTAAEAELIRVTGKEALAQLRAVLGVLEQGKQEASPPPLALADLDWLIQQSRSVGVAVERHDEGTAREVPATVGQTAYRIVQEALTNVHKHARTATTHVVLRYLPSTLEITVRNTAPRGSAPAMPGSGLGLNGLRERVETQSGRFTARQEPDGGFLVSAELPA